MQNTQKVDTNCDQSRLKNTQKNKTANKATREEGKEKLEEVYFVLANAKIAFIARMIAAGAAKVAMSLTTHVII